MIAERAVRVGPFGRLHDAAGGWWEPEPGLRLFPDDLAWLAFCLVRYGAGTMEQFASEGGE